MRMGSLHVFNQGFNNPFHSSSTTTVVATSGTLHLSATVPDDFDMNEQPNESEQLQIIYHNVQVAHQTGSEGRDQPMDGKAQKRFTCSECGEGFTRKNDMDVSLAMSIIVAFFVNNTSTVDSLSLTN